MTTAYDDLAYPALAFPQAHPDRLGTHAALFGLPFAPVETCRVLDVGGGEGANIIPMALAYPKSTFVGLDLSGEAVRRGQAVIAALDLRNITLIEGDLLEVDLGEEPFDYIIAHGVYAWVPEPIREGLMALIRRRLAPRGVAFVSYNAFPGCRPRQALRDMLLFSIRNVQGARARVEAAMERLRSLIADFPRDTAFGAMIVHEAERVVERSSSVLGHDELGDVYHPSHLHQFLAHAAEHGLQFLTEAGGERCGEGFLPPYALDDPGFDVVAHAQEMDFTDNRAFRQTLLVRSEVDLSRVPDASRLRTLHVSCQGRRTEAGRFAHGAMDFELTDAVLTRAVERLGDAWPATLPVAELVDDTERLAVLQRMYWVGALQLHAAPSRFPTTPGDRPQASPLARLQAAIPGARLTTLNHGMVDVEDAFSRAFIAGLDGSRTHRQIAEDISAVLHRDLSSATTQLEAQLNSLARMPLLVA